MRDDLEMMTYFNTPSSTLGWSNGSSRHKTTGYSLLGNQTGVKSQGTGTMTQPTILTTTEDWTYAPNRV